MNSTRHIQPSDYHHNHHHQPKGDIVVPRYDNSQQVKPASAYLTPAAGNIQKENQSASRMSCNATSREVSYKERFAQMRNRYRNQDDADIENDDDNPLSRDDGASAACKRCKIDDKNETDDCVILDHLDEDDLYQDTTDESDEDDDDELSSSSACHQSKSIRPSSDHNQTNQTQTRCQRQPASPIDEKISESSNDFYRKRADENLKHALLGLVSTSSAPTSSTATANYERIQISSNFEFKKPFPPPPLPTPALTSSSSSMRAASGFKQTSASGRPNGLFPISQIVSTSFNRSSEPPPPSVAATPESLVDNYQELLSSLITRASVKCTRLNFKTLNLVRKETLLGIVDRNRSNHILTPFDLFAYGRIKSKHASQFLVDSMNNLNLCTNNNSIHLQTVGKNSFQPSTGEEEVSSESAYNYVLVHKLDKLRKYYRPNDRNYMKENGLLLNCVSSFLMPFFFDIFDASELQSYKKEIVDMLLLLKRSYKAQESPTYELLSSNYIENILWNCFALYKFKFEDDNRTRTGFLNYFLSYFSLMNELETLHRHAQERSSNHDQDHQQAAPSSEKSYLTKFEELNSIIPFLLEALVLNGLFKSSDLTRFQNFYTSKRLLRSSRLTCRSSLRSSEEEDDDQHHQHSLLTSTDRLSVDLIPADQVSHQSTTSSLESNYLDNSMRRLLSTEEANFPLKLKSLCRICVKKSMKEFKPETINQLNIPNAIKPFLLFDDEVGLLFRANKRFISSSTTKSKCSWY